MVGCGVGGHDRGAMKSKHNTNPDNQPNQNPNPGSRQAKTPPRVPMAKISSISALLSVKSKMAMFSDKRSIFDVRGIAATFCCTSQRRQT